MAEVAGHGAGRDDQRVIGNGRAVPQHHGLRSAVDSRHLRLQDGHVVARLQQAPHGPGDVVHRQDRRGRLVEQRLEQVMILTIDHRDPRAQTLHLLNGRQACESGADHDDAVVGPCHAECPAVRAGPRWSQVVSPGIRRCAARLCIKCGTTCSTFRQSFPHVAILANLDCFNLSRNLIYCKVRQNGRFSRKRSGPSGPGCRPWHCEPHRPLREISHAGNRD